MQKSRYSPWITYPLEAYKIEAASAFPEPPGTIPNGVLIQVSQSSRSIKPLTT